MNRRRFLALFVALAVSSCATAPKTLQTAAPDTNTLPERAQIAALNFDWDDNIVFMPTEVYLFDESNRIVKTIATDEFAKVREKIGKEGEWKNYRYNYDDQQGSFRNFRDDPRHNHFKDDIEKLVARSDNDWIGPVFSDFQLMLQSPRTAPWVSVITARGHSPEAMLEGLKVLQPQKLIRNLPLGRRLFAVSHPLFKALASNPSEIKVNVMMQLLDELNAIGFPSNSQPITDPDGLRTRPLHYWEFSDDDYGNIKAAMDILSKQVRMARWPYVKVVLRYTGKNTPTIPPHAIVLTPVGEVRPLEGQEEVERDELIHQMQTPASSSRHRAPDFLGPAVRDSAVRDSAVRDSGPGFFPELGVAPFAS